MTKNPSAFSPAPLDQDELLKEHASLAERVRAEHNDFEAWTRLAAIETALEDLEAAQICWNNAKVAAHNILGTAADLVRADRPKEALASTHALTLQSTQLIALDPELGISLAQNRGAALVEDGDPKAAVGEFLTALRLLRSQETRDHIAIARVLQMISAAAFAIDHLKRASRLLRAARKEFEKGRPTAEDLLQLLLSEGTIAYESGDWASASKTFRDAAGIAAEHAHPEIAAFAHGQHALAALRARDYPTARLFFERALAIARARGGALLQATAAWAAEYDLVLGERLPSCAHLENALVLLDEANAAHDAPLARIPAARGAVLLALGRNQEALDALFEAFFTYRNPRNPQPLSQAYVAGHIAGALANTGAMERALLWVRKAERTIRQRLGDNHPARLSSLVTTAAMLSKTGCVEEALTILEHVVALEPASLSRIIEAGHSATEASRQRLAVEAFHAFAAISLRSPASDDSDARVLDYYLASIGLARRLRAAPKNSDSGGWRALSDTPGVCLVVAVRLFDVSEGSAAKPWSLGWSAPRAAVFSRRGHSTQRVDGADVMDLKADLAAWRRAVQIGWRGDPPARLKAVLDSVFDAIESNGALALVASSFLHAAPLSAYRPDAAIVELEADFDAGRDLRLVSCDDILVVVSEDFSTRIEEKWHLCQSIAAEAAAAAGQASAVQLLGHSATPERVCSALARRPRMAHIIAHGRASLDVSPEPDPFSTAELSLSGGPLTAGVLASLNLCGIELVVLSACSTALGEPIESEGSASLASALLEAGVRAVLASLWPVGSDATSQFMVAFYYALPREGAVRALVHAQTRLRQDGHAPRDWAGWRLFARGPHTAQSLFNEAISGTANPRNELSDA